MRAKTIAIAYIVLGVSWSPLNNNRKGDFSDFVLGVGTFGLWFFEKALVKSFCTPISLSLLMQ